MRKLVKLVIVAPILILATIALAQQERIQGNHRHGESQVDFFKINGQPAISYPIIQSSPKSFTLPDYNSPKNFLVNQAIDIEINPNVLETAFIKAHNSTIPDAKFIWEFGDGQTASGTENQHTYTKPGSYLLSIYIKSKLFDRPLLFRTTLLHILPNKNYKLPKAVITINKQLILEHFRAVKISFKRPVRLDGTRSIRGSSKIIGYFWDLSDTTGGKEPKLTHTYNQASYNAIPILRVIDRSGFISDAFVELRNLDTSSEQEIFH